MAVILDSRTDGSERAQALDELGRLGRWLQNTDRIPKLIGLYDEFRERDERAGVLMILVKADDPRALPLFMKILNEEQNLTHRLIAAYGLANWNVGRGVDELIRLLECTTSMEDCAAVRGQAANNLHGLNDRKGWGCPEDDIRDLAVAASNGDSDEYVKAFSSGYREWFEANKRRFPDWKPSDPLPALQGEHPAEQGAP